MKKTLALLLCLAMLVTALSVNVFAETTPSVTVVTHQSSAANKIDFAVTLKDFTDLKGVDLTIKGDDGVKFTGVTSSDLKSKLELNENYVISQDEKTLHIVELATDIESALIIVNAEINNSVKHTITVEGQLAKSGKELFDPVKFNDGEIAPYVAPEDVKVEVAPEEEVVVEQTVAGEGYFIPYGAVYNGTADAPEYIDKDADGKFSKVTANTTVVKFPIPDNGFGTYGVSDGTVKEKPAKQFGNYVAEYKPESRTYATFVVAGDWAGFRDWYLSNKGISDADLIDMLYKAYKAKKDGGDKRSYIPYGVNANGTKYLIQVASVQQNNYLWKTADKLEYGVRFTNVVDGREYATVAYYAEGETINFAKEIRAEKHNAQ